MRVPRFIKRKVTAKYSQAKFILLTILGGLFLIFTAGKYAG